MSIVLFQSTPPSKARHEAGRRKDCAAPYRAFLKVVDASRDEESRDAIIGMDTRWHLLFVVHSELEEDAIRLISARKATRVECPGCALLVSVVLETRFDELFAADRDGFVPRWITPGREILITWQP